jgi:hypothetical protein
MEATLIQPSRVQDDGAPRCKLLLCKMKHWDLSRLDVITRISTG